MPSQTVAQKRLSSLAKARKVRSRNAVKRRRGAERNRQAFRVWVLREREAFSRHVLEPGDPKLLGEWRRLLGEMPELYGRRKPA